MRYFTFFFILQRFSVYITLTLQLTVWFRLDDHVLHAQYHIWLVATILDSAALNYFGPYPR